MAMKKKKSKNYGNESIWITFAAVIAIGIIISMILFGGAEMTDDGETTGEKEDTANDSSNTNETDLEIGIDVDVTTDGTSDLPDTEFSDSTESETVIDTPTQTIPLGIYKKNGKKCYLITEYKSQWPENDDDPLWDVDTWTYSTPNLICDVAYFAVFTSQEEEINFTYWDETWVDRWEGEGLDDSYKIGFQFTVYLNNGRTESATVLGPKDTFALEEYFELYLYDCVAHAHDSWYSHITEKTNFEDTKNVMVKVTLRDGCYDIAFIELTAFVYSSADEFDADGNYKGTNKATCIIERET